MSVARSSFIEAGPRPTQPKRQFPGQSTAAGVFGRRLVFKSEFPNRGGDYNLSYLKPDASAGVLSTDEIHGSMVGLLVSRLGVRVSAITPRKSTGSSPGISEHGTQYHDFLITHARWLMTGTAPGEIFIDLEREGQNSLVTVELDPEPVGARVGRNAAGLSSFRPAMTTRLRSILR